jgi:toxin YoeB
VILAFSARAWNDYLWFQNNDKQLLKKTNELIKDTLRSPFEGIGKPEPLKRNLSGYWSRRTNDEHRLVYKVTSDFLIIASCKGHYE